MHQELDRLRRELKQRIFVGEPGGETFVAAAPEQRIESMREAAAAPADEAAPVTIRRRLEASGQTTFDDY